MAVALRVLILIITAILLLSPAGFNATSQPVNIPYQSTSGYQPGYNQAIIELHKAESAGATANEVAPLVTLLNEALDLNEQALKLSPLDAQRQTLLAQADQILNEVVTRANQLEVMASQRNFTNQVVAYGSGAAASILATLAYVYSVSFWRKYKIKRTFQMKIIPK